jgi:copper chaperone NosL
MIISEARFASAYRLPDGTEKLFDDTGGMLKHGHANGEIADASAWVHDYDTEEWVVADDAFFIVTRSIATPMAFGIISFGDGARAEAFAADVDADVVGWETILLLPPEDLPTIDDDHEHDAMQMDETDSETDMDSGKTTGSE